MSFYPKLIGAVCGVCAAGVLIYAGVSALDKAGVSADGILSSKPTLTVWYTEEKLEDYLSAMALEYQDATGVRVVPVLKSGLEYLEAVNDASIAEKSMPDVYLISNDGLEKAYLAGLAVNVKDQNAVLNTENFPRTALDAVTYQEHAVAYPLYFETSALVYNQTYLEQAAAELETDEVSLIPKTIDDIRNFADEYNAPETVESVFRWDVSDFFYNYFFAGNYITVGGSCGDDSSRINIYNQDAVYGLAAYQKLSQFFSIDAATSSYDQVVQDFLDGKLVYTIATTDILDRVAQAKADGSFAWEYGAASLPDISETVCSRGISVTGSVVVNGYGKHQDEADNFAAWLCTDSADKLFDRSTLVPVKKSAADGGDGSVLAGIQPDGSGAEADGDCELLGTDGDRGDENLGGRKRFGRFKRPFGKNHDTGNRHAVRGRRIYRSAYGDSNRLRRGRRRIRTCIKIQP